MFWRRKRRVVAGEGEEEGWSGEGKARKVINILQDLADERVRKRLLDAEIALGRLDWQPLKWSEEELRVKSYNAVYALLLPRVLRYVMLLPDESIVEDIDLPEEFMALSRYGVVVKAEPIPGPVTIVSRVGVVLPAYGATTWSNVFVSVASAPQIAVRAFDTYLASRKSSSDPLAEELIKTVCEELKRFGMWYIDRVSRLYDDIRPKRFGMAIVIDGSGLLAEPLLKVLIEPWILDPSNPLEVTIYPPGLAEGWRGSDDRWLIKIVDAFAEAMERFVEVAKRIDELVVKVGQELLESRSS